MCLISFQKWGIFTDFLQDQIILNFSYHTWHVLKTYLTRHTCISQISIVWPTHNLCLNLYLGVVGRFQTVVSAALLAKSLADHSLESPPAAEDETASGDFNDQVLQQVFPHHWTQLTTCTQRSLTFIWHCLWMIFLPQKNLRMIHSTA